MQVRFVVLCYVLFSKPVWGTDGTVQRIKELISYKLFLQLYSCVEMRKPRGAFQSGWIKSHVQESILEGTMRQGPRYRGLGGHGSTSKILLYCKKWLLLHLLSGLIGFCSDIKNGLKTYPQKKIFGKKLQYTIMKYKSSHF